MHTHVCTRTQNMYMHKHARANMCTHKTCGHTNICTHKYVHTRLKPCNRRDKNKTTPQVHPNHKQNLTSLTLVPRARAGLQAPGGISGSAQAMLRTPPKPWPPRQVPGGGSGATAPGWCGQRCFCQASSCPARRLMLIILSSLCSPINLTAPPTSINNH